MHLIIHLYLISIFRLLNIFISVHYNSCNPSIFFKKTLNSLLNLKILKIVHFGVIWAKPRTHKTAGHIFLII